MLAAGFVHETFRAKDPSLHVHLLIANVTIDPGRNEALALSYGEMMEMRNRKKAEKEEERKYRYVPRPRGI